MKTISNFAHPMFALFALACFAVLPSALAVDPRRDGSYTPSGQGFLIPDTTRRSRARDNSARSREASGLARVLRIAPLAG